MLSLESGGDHSIEPYAGGERGRGGGRRRNDPARPGPRDPVRPVRPAASPNGRARSGSRPIGSVRPPVRGPFRGGRSGRPLPRSASRAGPCRRERARIRSGPGPPGPSARLSRGIGAAGLGDGRAADAWFGAVAAGWPGGLSGGSKPVQAFPAARTEPRPPEESDHISGFEYRRIAPAPTVRSDTILGHSRMRVIRPG